jgi:hypothetical protein
MLTEIPSISLSPISAISGLTLWGEFHDVRREMQYATACTLSDADLKIKEESLRRLEHLPPARRPRRDPASRLLAFLEPITECLRSSSVVLLPQIQTAQQGAKANDYGCHDPRSEQHGSRQPRSWLILSVRRNRV